MIGLESQVFCSICNKQYKDNNLPRILTMCGHTYCELCISNMITKNISQQQADNGHPFSIECPEDGAQMKLTVKELKSFPKNIALIKVLDIKKTNSSFRDESFNLSKIVKKQQIQEDDETTDLISAINECKLNEKQSDSSKEVEQIKIFAQTTSDEKKLLKDIETKVEKQKEEEELCLLHQKPLQIICIIDHKKICSKCAIFGEHKGHEFKSIEEVENQRNQCYVAILQIFKQKEQTEHRMSNEQTQSDLIQILDKKRDILEKQVREEFRKLREEITKQQKIVLKKLHEAYKATEKRINSLLKVDENILKEFANWEIESYKLLKTLEGPELEPKINILYSKERKNQKTLQKGSQILKKIRQQEKNLVGKVQQILVHLQCKKSKKIFEFIPEFVQISEKSSIKQQMKSLKGRQKQQSIVVNTLLLESQQKQKRENLDCSIIHEFNKKNSQMDGSPLLEQSLLQFEESQSVNQKIVEQNVKNFNSEMEIRLPLQPNENFINKHIQQDSVSCSFMKLELESAKKFPPKTAIKNMYDDNNDFLDNSRCSILTSRTSIVMKKQSGQRANKKKLKSIRISEKYQKMLQGIYNNTVDTIDLTNAEVGDQTMMQICEFVKFSKARTIKFIRNKLTDSGIEKMLPALSNAQILNLSQNNLTQGVIDIFIKHRYGCLSGLKNLILSQNKIIERKHKYKIDQLRAMNIVVSV